jgi:SET domain-containing protein
LERPTDDPAGYDVLFVDAAAKGAVASRMSHSCMPNCQAVVMSCNGRLTIAVYTLRHVHSGEELTFDYSSVTESEKVRLGLVVSPPSAGSLSFDRPSPTRPRCRFHRIHFPSSLTLPSQLPTHAHARARARPSPGVQAGHLPLRDPAVPRLIPVLHRQ